MADETERDDELRDDERDDELRAEERALLLRWQPPGPPADFASRVLEEPSASEDIEEKRAQPSPPRQRALPERADHPLPSSRAGALAWGASALAVALAAALALSLRSSGGPDSPRPVAAPTFAALRWINERESIALGGRGIAVAEAGSALAWRRTGDRAKVEQEAGDVFYRVDPGGPFTVTTAAGEVRVTGTCFRVEVISMKPSKQGWIGAAAGAALATAVVVTVYEGKVVVASPSGSAQVKAGERATLAPDSPPALATSATPAPTVALAELPPAPPNATREELLARDEAMRQQVASLAQRVRQLQTVASASPTEPKRLTFDGKESWTDVPAETLLEFARECRVQIDFPPMNTGPFKLSPKLAEKLELSGEETATANAAFAELHTSWLRRLRALYLETTGDSSGAESLSMQALSEELREKAAGEGEADALQKRIAEERAGLLPAPTDLTRTSPYERYFRAFANLGDEAEALLAAKLGKEKAHAIRASDGGWPMRMGLAGCREGAKASEPE